MKRRDFLRLGTAALAAPVLSTCATPAPAAVVPLGVHLDITDQLDRWAALYALQRKPVESDDSLRQRIIHEITHCRGFSHD